ncbi:N-acetyl-gamma-glutamyl-phosphate reductase [Parvularcula sp. IMCC14364]|uniref:N-acetyl-gamma-glutamyl-phosphate reductase n=1 Tax=Parvularcula sp. IMCC14364 TaxID=3067902 RepID=UPI0027411A1C|nr:N-acetyl-gamma-glutamyl-phosphate reductase [Parvularcula sp. IMCC14364]
MTETFTIGLVGARGHTGRELLRLIDGHPHLQLVFAASRELAGSPVSDIAPAPAGLLFENGTAANLASRQPDVCILALPNGASTPFIDAFEMVSPQSVLVDLSADHRFGDGWAYGLPELYDEREGLYGAQRVANPGCYATAAQIAVHPSLGMLAGSPSVFGVSGYSGAGTTPSPKNDRERLHENLMPYALTDHIHEREISHHLGQRVCFTPHVHPAFSGILATVHLAFRTPQTTQGLLKTYQEVYEGHDLIKVQSNAPELKDGTDFPGVIIGGFAVSEDGAHGVIVAAEDNLLKGAAVQAIQNINLALKLDLLTGILPGKR